MSGAPGVAAAGRARPEVQAATRPWPLWLAAAGAVGAVVVAWAIRLVGVPGAPAFAADQRLGLFVGVAALCVMALMLRRSPSVAWIAGCVAASVVTADMVELGLAVRDPGGQPSTSAPVAAALTTTLTIAVAIAVGYAGAPGRRLHRVVTWLGIVVLAWVVVASVVSVSSIVRGSVAQDRASPVRWVTFPTRWWNYLALGFIGLGVLGDVAAADRRVRRRELARSRAASRREALTDRAASVIDELVPGRTAVRDAAIEAERARLAAELHADVLPAVRRALDAAEGGGSVERLATDLRDVLAEVEGMLAQRRSIVLEELGLLPALEWLAERVEERSETRVLLEVADGAPNVRPPRSVERAAFRIATLALDNAVRHAPGATVRVDLVLGRDRLALDILDDGPGFAPERTRDAVRDGRRGLGDMHDEAAGVGGSLRISSTPGEGTRITFAWPASD